MTFREFKLTALKVARNNASMFIILTLFPLCVGLRIRNGTLSPYTNWPTLVRYAVVLPGAYFLIFLTVAVLQHAADVKDEQVGNVTFGGAIGYELLLASVLALVLTLGAWGYSQKDLSPTDFVFSAAMGLLVFYCWPRPIRFTGGAIVQRSLLGATKSILLSEIAAAKFDPGQGCVLLTGNNGIRIVHSMLHARRKQFAQQLARLAGVRVSGLNA